MFFFGVALAALFNGRTPPGVSCSRSASAMRTFCGPCMVLSGGGDGGGDDGDDDVVLLGRSDRPSRIPKGPMMMSSTGDKAVCAAAAIESSRTDLARALPFPVRAAASLKQVPLWLEFLPDPVPKETVRSIIQETIEANVKAIEAKDETIKANVKAIEANAKAIEAKDELIRKEREELVFALSQYEAVLQPRVMLELALTAKYAESKVSMTARWDTFYAAHVVDEKGELRPIVKKIMSELGCTTKEERVIRDELKSIYSRLSHVVHNRLELDGADRGIYCGGRGTLGRANAVAINLLQKEGLLRFEIKYLDESFVHTHSFRPLNGDIIVVVPQA